MSAYRRIPYQPLPRPRHGRSPADNEEPCCICHRRLTSVASARWVHLIDGGACILHPEDASLYIADTDDLSLYPIGLDCAKKLGLEWSIRWRQRREEP